MEFKSTQYYKVLEQKRKFELEKRGLEKINSGSNKNKLMNFLWKDLFEYMKTIIEMNIFQSNVELSKHILLKYFYSIQKNKSNEIRNKYFIGITWTWWIFPTYNYSQTSNEDKELMSFMNTIVDKNDLIKFVLEKLQGEGFTVRENSEYLILYLQ